MRGTGCIICLKTLGGKFKMDRTVYVDLFFLINFSMDFLCFFLTCQLLSLKFRIWRVIAAAVLGGIYANVILLSGVTGPLATLCDIVACILMCAVALGFHKMLGNTLVYIAVSMTLGGFMTALFSLLNRVELPLGEISGDGISAYVLLILATLSAGLTLAGGKLFRKKVSRKYETISVSVGENERELRAFCDSGNILKDPISGKACVLASASALEGLVPPDILAIAKDKKVADFTELGSSAARRMRLIPTRTATGEGMLVAMRVDKMTLASDKKEIDALLAICDNEGFGDECSALLPSELLM